MGSGSSTAKNADDNNSSAQGMRKTKSQKQMKRTQSSRSTRSDSSVEVRKGSFKTPTISRSNSVSTAKFLGQVAKSESSDSTTSTTPSPTSVDAKSPSSGHQNDVEQGDASNRPEEDAEQTTPVSDFARLWIPSFLRRSTVKKAVYQDLLTKVLDEDVAFITWKECASVMENITSINEHLMCIRDDGAKALAEVMRNKALPNLRDLNLQRNCICDAGVKELTKAVRHTPKLRRLNLIDNESITAEVEAKLIVALKKHTIITGQPEKGVKCYEGKPRPRPVYGI